MIALLAAACVLASDPKIERVERLAGPAFRPYLLAPVAVTVSSAAGFEGDVVVQSSFGFSYARAIRVPAGGIVRVLLPAVDPVAVTAGSARVEVPRERAPAERLVGVDERLSYAAELVSDDRVLYVRIRAEDLGPLVSDGLGEAFDLILIAEGEPRGAAVRAATRAEADSAVAEVARRPERPRIELVDPLLWGLAPREGGAGAKRDFAVFFATVYAFASFVALVVASRGGPRRTVAAALGVALLGGTAYAAVFPRGQTWAAGASCRVVYAGGASEEWQVWFAGAGREGELRFEFPRVMKPVLVGSGDVREPFLIRVRERGYALEGLRLPPGRAACFAAVVPGGPVVSPGAAAALRRSGLQRGGTAHPWGEVAAGQAIPEALPPGAAPDGPERQIFRRFLSDDCIFGWLEETAATDVRSPDLGTAPRRGPGFFVQRLK